MTPPRCRCGHLKHTGRCTIIELASCSHAPSVCSCLPPNSPATVAKEIALKLGESCVHVPGPPKVDCPECCEAVLTDALTTFAAQQVSQTTQERDEWRSRANNMLSQNEDLSVQLLKVKGEWPTTDGSPMGIAQAKIAKLEATITQQMRKAEQRVWEEAANYMKQIAKSRPCCGACDEHSQCLHAEVAMDAYREFRRRSRATQEGKG